MVPQRAENLNSSKLKTLSSITNEETPAILLYHPWHLIAKVSQIENLPSLNCYNCRSNSGLFFSSLIPKLEILESAVLTF
jgi:hypothetical protein